MKSLKFKLYKYPIFLAFLSFWTGIFLFSYGWYSIIGFIFGVILLRYILGADIIYPALFFLTGLLYMQAKNTSKIHEGRVAVRATVLSKGIIQVDSVIGSKNSPLKGKKVNIKGLSGFERGDIIEALLQAKQKQHFIVGNIVKIRKIGRKKNPLFVINRYLKQKIEELSTDTSVQGFMLGVLLGYRDFIPYSVMDDFKKSGTMHILALSGLHIGIIAAFLYFLLLPLTGHRNRALIVSSFLILLYMLIIGTSPSIFRAYLIFLVIILVKLTKRRTSFLNALGISGLISLTFYPSWAFSYSFILSYLAVYGIIAFSDMSKKHFVNYILISLGAVLFTLPITSYLSGYFPLLSFLFNLIVIPLFGIVLSIFFVLLLLYIVFPPLIPLYTLASTITGTVFLKIIHIFANISPVIHVKISNPVQVAIYYLVILAIPVIISILKQTLNRKQEVSIESS